MKTDPTYLSLKAYLDSIQNEPAIFEGLKTLFQIYLNF